MKEEHKKEWRTRGKIGGEGRTMQNRPEEPPLPSSPRGGAPQQVAEGCRLRRSLRLLRADWVGPGIKMRPCWPGLGWAWNQLGWARNQDVSVP
jgi:hypothetical protein